MFRSFVPTLIKRKPGLTKAVADVTQSAAALNSNPTLQSLNKVVKAANAAWHQKLMDEHAVKKFGVAPFEDPDDAVYSALSSLAHYTSASPPVSNPPLNEAVVVERVEKDLCLSLGASPPELVKFRMKWYSQRTPVDMGLNAYRLTMDVIASDLIWAGSALKTELNASGFASDSAPDGTTWYNARLLDLEGDYDHSSSLSDDDLAIRLLRQVYAAAVRAANRDHTLPAELRTMSFKQFSWWLSYALSHPSNWAFDRLSIAVNIA